MGRPWPQQAQNPALKMHIASLLDFSLFLFFPPKGSCDLQPPDGFAALHEAQPMCHSSPLSTEDEDNLAPGTCTPRPLQATCEPCKHQPQPTENPGHRKKKSQQVGRELCWCLQPLVGSSPSCSWQWFPWWQAQPGRDKLGCTSRPPSLRIKKSQSNIDN